MENMLDQWMEDFTRLRGEDEPSMLDLVFTRKPELQPIIKYLSPMGKSDHVLMEVELQERTLVRRGDNYKSGRLNYARANFEGLREFFERTDWRAIMNGKTAQEKYEIFLKRYREGVERYVPKYKIRDSKYTWYNTRCTEA